MQPAATTEQTQRTERPRVAILWQAMSGYAHAAFSELAGRGVEVLVVHQAGAGDAPFDADAITRGLRSTSWVHAPDAPAVEAAVAELAPHALLVSSWHIDAYRRAARRRRGETLRVLCMDNQWWATPKQVLGVAASRLLIGPAYDAAFLPGERSADFARRLGFPDERIIRGLCSCDHDRFAPVAAARGGAPPPRAFAFVGRLVPVKGIDVLAEAYRRYRDMVEDPWPLGSAASAWRRRGWPASRASSTWASSSPATCRPSWPGSGAWCCRAGSSRGRSWSTRPPRPGCRSCARRSAAPPAGWSWTAYNGRVVSPGRADALARALAAVSGASDAQRAAMSAASSALARQFTSAGWADHLLTRIGELRSVLGLPPLPAVSPARA